MVVSVEDSKWFSSHEFQKKLFEGGRLTPSRSTENCKATSSIATNKITVSISERNAMRSERCREGVHGRSNESGFFGKQYRVIVASRHYFTIRPNEKALGQLTKKSDRSPQKTKERKKRRGTRERWVRVRVRRSKE